MEILETALFALALLVAVPTGFILLQSLAAQPLPPVPRGSPPGPRSSMAVLIPAHDEQDSIAEVLVSLRPQLASADRVLVVADNCADATAERARAMGAEVVARTDPERRGKGYALAFGIDHLRAAPPAILVIVDADCRLEPGALDHLAQSVQHSGRPGQAAYLMGFGAGDLEARAGDLKAVSAFAFFFKNWVRPLGLKRLGLPCQLTGSGTALPWELIARVPPDTANLVEDMQLGVDLTRLGYPPAFVPRALVWSRLPDRSAPALAQRRRWEHGHLATALHQGPRLLGHSIASRDAAGLALALDLMVPPLSLLALGGALLWALCAGAWWIGASAAPWLIATLALGSLAGAVFCAWHRHGRARLKARTLLAAPFYAVRKLPLYLAFWTRREQEWVRTERSSSPRDPADGERNSQDGA